MMQTVPKWKIQILFASREVVVWISDSHIENVLRQVASMQFTEDGTERAQSVIVSKS